VKDYRDEDRAMRAKLERNSGGGQRVDMAGLVNQLTKIHDRRALPGMGAYAMIRLLQSNGGAEGREARAHNRAHDAFMNKLGDFDRLHPDSAMARRVPASETSGIPANQRDDARDQPFVTPVVAGRTYVAAGDGGSRMDSDQQTRDDYLPDSLSVEEMASLASAMAARRYY
jgi:hypothetical protein